MARVPFTHRWRRPYTPEIVTGLETEIALGRLDLPPDADKELPEVVAALRVRFNPNRDESYFSGINEMLMMMTLLAISLPAAALIREREHGTIEQLLIAPLLPTEILLAKTLASTLVLLVGVALAVLGVLIPIFHVPVRGSLALYFGCAAIFIYAMSGLGSVAASVCKTMPQAAMLIILVSAPLLFLSLTWTPPEAMPMWLADLTVLSPLRWFNEIAFGFFLRGASLRDIAFPFFAMSALGAVTFLWGALRFRARFWMSG